MLDVICWLAVFLCCVFLSSSSASAPAARSGRRRPGPGVKRGRPSRASPAGTLNCMTWEDFH